jgi:hypothetical protein
MGFSIGFNDFAPEVFGFPPGNCRKTEFESHAGNPPGSRETEQSSMMMSCPLHSPSGELCSGRFVIAVERKP